MAHQIKRRRLMKKFIYIIGVTLLAVMTACTSEDLVPQQTEGLILTDGDLIEQISFTVPELISDEPLTKGLYDITNVETNPGKFMWAQGDTIGVFSLPKGQYGWQLSNQIYFPFNEKGTGSTAFFDGAGWGLRTGYSYSAYYPYKFENRNYREIEIDYRNQRQLMDGQWADPTLISKELSKYDFMVSGAITPTDKSLKINMKRLGAIAWFDIDIQSAFADGDLSTRSFKEMILQSNEDVFSVKNTLDLMSENPVLESMEKASSISIALGGEKGTPDGQWVFSSTNDYNPAVYMALPPTDLTGKTLQLILIDNNNNRYVAQVEGKNIEAGKFYHFACVANKVGSVITNPNIIAAIEAQASSLEFAIEYTSEGYIDPYGEWNYYLNTLDLSNKHDPSIVDELPLLYHLTNLDVSGNDLDRLDVSGLNELTRLVCSNNKLKELILPSGNSSYGNDLVELVAMYNQLTSIDLSRCTNLEYLYLEGNKLPYVNVNYCTNLKYLVVSENELTSIDVSNNTELENLTVSTNKLKNIDVSNNNKLTDLIVGRNNLKNLDINHLTSLLILSAYECGLSDIDLSSFPELTYLDVSGNNLTTLDLTSNTKLKILRISDNPLSGVLDYTSLSDLEQFYCSYTKVEELNLYNLKNLTRIEATNNTELGVLKCFNCNLNKLFVLGCTNLYSLQCANNKLTSLLLSSCKSISTLSCEYNELTSLSLNIQTVPGVEKIRWISCYNNHLISLDLSNSDLYIWNQTDMMIRSLVNVGKQLKADGNNQELTLYVPKDKYDTEAKRTALQELLRQNSLNMLVVVAVK